MDEWSCPLLLLGGGRWSRTLLPVLAACVNPARPILWVSRTDPVERMVFATERGLSGRVEALTNLTPAMARHPFAAVIATAPADHANDARTVIEAGAHVLVEKPLCLDLAEAHHLVNLARLRDRLLAVDLEFRTAPFLLAFVDRIRGRPAPARIEVLWGDPAEEYRHGLVKRPDVGTPVVWDIYPHVWSIWQAILPDIRPVLRKARRDTSGRVELEFTAHETELYARLDRRASGRIREVAVAWSDGKTASLDFAEEPGTVRLGSGPPVRQPDGLPRPLDLVITEFLRAAGEGDRDFDLAAVRCLDSVSGAAAATKALCAQDLDYLRANLGRTDPAVVARRRRILLENVVPALRRDDPEVARRASESFGWLDYLDADLVDCSPDLQSTDALFDWLANAVLRRARQDGWP